MFGRAHYRYRLEYGMRQVEFWQSTSAWVRRALGVLSFIACRLLAGENWSGSIWAVNGLSALHQILGESGRRPRHLGPLTSKPKRRTYRAAFPRSGKRPISRNLLRRSARSCSCVYIVIDASSWESAVAMRLIARSGSRCAPPTGS